jgi:hypothetical protein
MRALIIVWVAVVVYAAAWAADTAVAPAYETVVLPGPSPYDGTMELTWDSGSSRWWSAFYSGADAWVANDFDITTLSSYNIVHKIKVQGRIGWPNWVWDGFRLGVYGFSGGVPGSLLWGPTFVVPTGTTGWKEFSVNWVLPGGVTQFLAAQEQFYNLPDCDAYAIDSNPTFLGHSWEYYAEIWSRYDNPQTAPYRNLMIRVIMNDLVDVAPASLGRVKALYR